MIEKMTEGLISRMAAEQLVNAGQRKQYEYAVISLAERFLTVGTILLISVWMKLFVPTVLFLVFLLELRKRTGGFHFNCFYQCYFSTIITYFSLAAGSSFFIRKFRMLCGMFFVSVCIILFIGSVNHPNMHMDVMELTAARKAARITVLLEMGVICCFMTGKADHVLISYMMIAVILCAFLLSVAKIIKQEVKQDEEYLQKSFEDDSKADGT